jgi:hypothetical protein
MECVKQVKYVIIFVSIMLLANVINCSFDEPQFTHKQPKIYPVEQSERDQIKALGNGWFKVVGKVRIQNITPKEAEKQAIFNACRDAIQYYCGVEISERTLDLQAASQNKTILDHFSSLSKQFTRGRILEKKLIHKQKRIEEGDYVIVVVLEVRVGKEKGKKDPYFNVTAELDRDMLKEGEQLKLSVKSSKDCYITVLNICSNDSVYVLFPNQYRSNNFLKADKIFQLPNEDDRAIGLSFPTRLFKGKEKDVEMIKILATKENISLFRASHPLSPYGTYEVVLTELLNWLIEIPRSEIEEVDIQYIITK